METLFVSREARLRQRENTLAITLDGKTRAFPIERIQHVVLLAESVAHAHRMLGSSDWSLLQDRLFTYVKNYACKVVPARGGFQF